MKTQTTEKGKKETHSDRHLLLLVCGESAPVCVLCECVSSYDIRAVNNGAVLIVPDDICLYTGVGCDLSNDRTRLLVTRIGTVWTERHEEKKEKEEEKNRSQGKRMEKVTSVSHPPNSFQHSHDCVFILEYTSDSLLSLSLSRFRPRESVCDVSSWVSAGVEWSRQATPTPHTPTPPFALYVCVCSLSHFNPRCFRCVRVPASGL